MKNNSMNLLRIASLSLATFAFAAGPALAQQTTGNGTASQQGVQTQPYANSSQTGNENANVARGASNSKGESPNASATNKTPSKWNNGAKGSEAAGQNSKNQ